MSTHERCDGAFKPSGLQPDMTGRNGKRRRGECPVCNREIAVDQTGRFLSHVNHSFDTEQREKHVARQRERVAVAEARLAAERAALARLDSRCPDCGVAEGQRHRSICDVATCTSCGSQYIGFPRCDDPAAMPNLWKVER